MKKYIIIYIYIANLNLHDKREALSLRSLANYINIGKIRIIQQTREARSARQKIYKYIYQESQICTISYCARFARSIIFFGGVNYLNNNHNGRQ